MKLTKPLIFISGFVAGVVYCLYRDVLSKPVEPVDPDDEDTWNSCPPDERGKVTQRYYANGRPKSVNWRVAMGMPPKPVDDDLYADPDAPFPFVNIDPAQMSIIELEEYLKLMKRDVNLALQPQPAVDDDLYDGLCLENVTRAINNLPER